MKKFKRLNLVSVLLQIEDQIRANIDSKFNAFYTKKLEDNNLTSVKIPASEYPTSDSHIPPSLNIRLLSKLKTMIIKNFKKSNPVLNFANVDFLPVKVNNKGVQLNLFSVNYADSVPEVSRKKLEKALKRQGYNNIDLDSEYDFVVNPILHSIHFKCINKINVINRYARYLEYLAKKNNIPMSITPKCESSKTPGLDGKWNISLDININGWRCINSESERRYLQVQEGAEDDSLFSTQELWTVADGSSAHARVYKYHISRVFLHLDKMMKVINTLSRKIDYGYSAFNFRTA